MEMGNLLIELVGLCESHGEIQFDCLLAGFTSYDYIT